MERERFGSEWLVVFGLVCVFGLVLAAMSAWLSDSADRRVLSARYVECSRLCGDELGWWSVREEHHGEAGGVVWSCVCGDDSILPL